MIFVFIRIVAFFGTLRILFPAGTPALFKSLFAIIISILISSTMQIEYATNIDNIVLFTLYGINETITGIMLGYITNLCFYSIRMAGSMMDQQMGLSMINMFDPNSMTQTTLINNLMNWTALMIFFSMDGHHVLIRGIRYSFELIPIGKSFIDNNIDYIINIFVQCFLTGFKIAIPIVLCLLMADFILGLISRSVPQLNVMIIGMPLKILVGIALFIISIPLIVNQISHLLSQIPKMYEGTFALAPMFFMGSTDKTEEATPKKKGEQRKKGNIAKSKELPIAMTLLAFTLLVPTLFSYVVNTLKSSLNYFLSLDFYMNINYSSIEKLVIAGLMDFFKIFLPIAIPFLVLGIVANLFQVGILFTGETLKPNLSKLNPISGFKNMFSMRSLSTLIKDTAIISILAYIGYTFFQDNYLDILKLGNIYLPTLMYTVKDLVYSILSKICVAMIVIAVADYVYQRYSHKKQLRMTKQEVKDEYKNSEGDPEIKAKIKQKQRQISSQRTMQAVPSATVIVTNPTHLSIAVRYEKGKDQVPVVVAKGADYLAFKIREIAKGNDIPIIENKPIARLLYKQVEIDQEIPEDMYQAFAEILVAVYKIKNRYKVPKR
ncbi:fused FliR family export protein/FlhB family type III secretion system protein [Clostridioides difficile]|nr:fused FliR family export protein/FlhB family type III secretion system protein [Clostridioides difficile]MDI2824318.1 fused FliR family export protein/FlhB family type III secretion system protein [Clostridioides difficile]HBF9017502.1 fused FliR family export protein/FlhB family type III secretion system protein [Clostridioides difficile]